MADFLDVTHYRGLYDTAPTGSSRLTWDELLGLFGTHHRLLNKDNAPGFGPYSTLPVVPEVLCRLHPKDRYGLHRCDKLVDRLSLAVFDADMGTEADIQETERRLVAAGLAYALYSSFSYPVKVSYRLVLPLAKPLEPFRWGSLRPMLKQKFALPIDLKKCGGASHFYFLPACPPGVTPIFRHSPGSFLEPDQYVLPLSRLQAMSEALAREGALAGDTSEEAPRREGALDLSPAKEALRKQITLLKRRGDPRAAELEAVLAGEPLAKKGSRNDTLASTAFWLVHRLADIPDEEIEGLLAPSVFAMRAEGSSLTLTEMRRMVSSARAKKREAERLQETVRTLFRSEYQTRVNNIPTTVLED